MELAGLSLADRTERVLEKAILEGGLAPGSRLALPKLSEAYGIGATPLREGLSRLAARGLVTMSGNKGFRVAELSRADLLDITQSRVLVERAALALAFEKQDGEWEDRVAAANHRLGRVIRGSDSPMLEGTPDYDAAHKAFHAAIISGCGLRRLMAVQASLYDSAYRYRRILGEGRITRDYALAVHAKLAALVLARDVPAALAALEAHLMITIEVVYHDKN